VETHLAESILYGVAIGLILVVGGYFNEKKKKKLRS
jgi:hypothetical protein